MSALARSSLTLRSRGGGYGVIPGRATQYGRSPAYRRISSIRTTIDRPTISALPHKHPFPSSTSLLSASKALPSDLSLRILCPSIRSFHQHVRLFQQQQPKEEVKDPPRPDGAASESSESSKPAGDGAESASGASAGKDGAEGDSKEDGKQESNQEKKEEAPPPRHGNKSPLQVFMDTLKSEFQSSKEWNEGTKQLSAGYSEFTQNPNLKRAKGAYSAGTEAVTSATGKVLKTTATGVGKTAAYAWDTLPVRGIRAGVNATGSGLEKITRPLRETEAYKSMSEVIDDGSSSRYGGWAEKEQRRKRREAREMQEAVQTGRPVRRPEKVEEDPNAGTNVTLHKDAAWKESWKSFRDRSPIFRGLNNFKETYAESENPLISTARSVTDRIAGFFAENETAMVIKKFREMDPSFQLEPFLQDMREYILPEVLDAYVKGDVEVLRMWLSAAQYQVYDALMRQYTTNGLKSDGRILDIRNVDVLSARLLEPGEIPVFILTCRTQEVHVYRNAKSGQLAAGMEDRVQQVTYAIGVTRLPEDVSNPETRGWRLIELQKSARDYM